MPTPYGEITTTTEWLTPAQEEPEVVEDSTNEEDEQDDL